MRGIERNANPLQDAKRSGRLQPPLFGQQRVKIASLDVAHRQVESAVGVLEQSA